MPASVRRRSRPCPYAGATFLAIALETGLARPEPREVIRLDFTAPLGCPTAEQFQREVTARTDRAHFMSGPQAEGANGQGTAKWQFIVRVSEREGVFSGRLRSSSGNGEVTTRDFQSDTCGDVVSALALVAALAIDPQASTAPLTELAGPEPMELEEAPVSRPSPRPRLPTAPARPRVIESRQTEQGTLSFFAGFDALIATGPAPIPLLAPEPFAEVRENQAPSRTVWALSGRVALLAARTGWVGPADDRASFTWLALRLEPCVWRPTAWRELSLFGCAVLDVGALGAKGIPVERPELAWAPWVGLGVGARARWTLGNSLFVEAAGGLSVPLVRYTIVFLEPRRVIHQSRAGVWGEVGVGLGL